jgi:hypothetical protein
LSCTPCQGVNNLHTFRVEKKAQRKRIIFNLKHNMKSSVLSPILSLSLACFIAVWTQGFVLAKKALYHLSHIFSPFCSDYFKDRGLVNYLSRLALNLDPPDISLPSN